MKKAAIVILLGAMGMVRPLQAQGATASSPPELARMIDKMRPGQWNQRVVVLRNGFEIGRSAAIINDDDPGTHVIALTAGKDGTARWLYAGHADDAGSELDEATINRPRFPCQFYGW